MRLHGPRGGVTIGIVLLDRAAHHAAPRQLLRALRRRPTAKDGKHWVCGGSQLLIDRLKQKGTSGGLRVPTPGDDLKTWWGWLTNPLVMQLRPGDFGDNLTGVRTILSIWPAPKQAPAGP